MILDTNLKNKATGQYLDFDANSMVKFNHAYWVAGEEGLYKLDLIDTTHEAYFITAKMDFGINNDKRLRYVYLSLESTENLKLTINTEKVAAISYDIVVASEGQNDIRIPINRSLYGRFWTFKISGNCDFSVDEIKILPIIRNVSF